MTTATNWQSDAHGIDGQQGSHYDLARYAECKGFTVEPDTDDNERSFIARAGDEDFDLRIVGEIVGDAEAVIRMRR